MNYFLEREITVDNVIESNMEPYKYYKIFDNRSNTVCKTLEDSPMYLKMRYEDIQFVVLHNILCKKVEAKIYDESGNLIDQKTEFAKRQATVQLIRGGERVIDYKDNNIVIEFDEILNPGFLELYIYPDNGLGFVGKIDYGVPTFLGCLEWNFSYGAQYASIPNKANSPQTGDQVNILSFGETATVNYTVFKDQNFEDDKFGNYIYSKLSSLMNMTYEVVQYYSDEDKQNHDESGWRPRKVTFIDPFVSKRAWLFSVENFKMNGKNSIVSNASVSLKSWYASMDFVNLDDVPQTIFFMCDKTGASNCTKDLYDWQNFVYMNEIHLSRFNSKKVFYFKTDYGNQQNIIFRAKTLKDFLINIKVVNLTKENTKYGTIDSYNTSKVYDISAHKDSFGVISDFAINQNPEQDFEAEFEFFGKSDYFFRIDLNGNMTEYKIEVSTKLLDYGQNKDLFGNLIRKTNFDLYDTKENFEIKQETDRLGSVIFDYLEAGNNAIYKSVEYKETRSIHQITAKVYSTVRKRNFYEANGQNYSTIFEITGLFLKNGDFLDHHDVAQTQRIVNIETKFDVFNDGAERGFWRFENNLDSEGGDATLDYNGYNQYYDGKNGKCVYLGYNQEISVTSDSSNHATSTFWLKPDGVNLVFQLSNRFKLYGDRFIIGGRAFPHNIDFSEDRFYFIGAYLDAENGIYIALIDDTEFIFTDTSPYQTSGIAILKTEGNTGSYGYVDELRYFTGTDYMNFNFLRQIRDGNLTVYDFTLPVADQTEYYEIDAKISIDKIGKMVFIKAEQDTEYPEYWVCTTKTYDYDKSESYNFTLEANTGGKVKEIDIYTWGEK